MVRLLLISHQSGTLKSRIHFQFQRLHRVLHLLIGCNAVLLLTEEQFVLKTRFEDAIIDSTVVADDMYRLCFFSSSSVRHICRSGLTITPSRTSGEVAYSGILFFVYCCPSGAVPRTFCLSGSASEVNRNGNVSKSQLLLYYTTIIY